jgi:hypothetical protein
MTHLGREIDGNDDFIEDISEDSDDNNDENLKNVVSQHHFGGFEE